MLPGQDVTHSRSGPQRQIDRGLGDHHPTAPQLMNDPPRTPPRVRAPRLQDRDLHHRVDLMRGRQGPVGPIDQPLQTAGLSPRQPRVQRLT